MRWTRDIGRQSAAVALCVAAVSCALFLGCAHEDPYEKEIREHGFIPLPGPQDDFELGALGKDVVDQERVHRRVYFKATDVFSKKFLETRPSASASWFEQFKMREFAVKAVAKFTAESLQKNGQLSAGFDVRGKKIDVVNWGDLRIRRLDLDTLSRTLVGAWYGFGEDIGATRKGLALLKLTESKCPDRPWIITETLTSEGLTMIAYDESKKAVSAGQGGPVSAEGSYGTADYTKLQPKGRMVLGFDGVLLVDISPPLPQTTRNLKPHHFTKPHRLTWTRLLNGQTEVVEVSPNDFEFRERNDDFWCHYTPDGDFYYPKGWKVAKCQSVDGFHIFLVTEKDPGEKCPQGPGEVGSLMLMLFRGQQPEDRVQTKAARDLIMIAKTLFPDANFSRLEQDGDRALSEVSLLRAGVQYDGWFLFASNETRIVFAMAMAPRERKAHYNTRAIVEHAVEPLGF